MRTERGLDRFVTFLDAVVAIAITLLVLPLAELFAGEAQQAGLGAVLVEEAPDFGAFFLSFAVIAQLWLVHHRLVEPVGAYDRAFLLLNLVWILTIVLLPFATQVVSSEYGRERLAVLLYIGTITVSSACLSGVSLLLWRRPALRRGDAGPAEPPREGLATTGLLVVALVLGTAVPAVSYWAMLLLFLTSPLEAWLRRRWPG
ncbi:TMEM175 family protein [Geodermatophilus sp. SYSU D00691]